MVSPLDTYRPDSNPDNIRYLGRMLGGTVLGAAVGALTDVVLGLAVRNGDLLVPQIFEHPLSMQVCMAAGAVIGLVTTARNPEAE